MAGRGVSTPAVALAAVGAFAVYAGATGTGFAAGLKSLIAGTQPAPPLTGGADAGATVGDWVSANGSGAGPNAGIAAAGMAYVGTGGVYRYGGARPGAWDCSGFVNYVISHDLNLPIVGYPRGGFTGAHHGPVTGQWYVWGGCVTIARGDVQAGDIMCFPGHMGIAISNSEMVNCPGPNGTPAPIVTHIDHEAHGPLRCRRLKIPVPAGASL